MSTQAGEKERIAIEIFLLTLSSPLEFDQKAAQERRLREKQLINGWIYKCLDLLPISRYKSRLI